MSMSLARTALSGALLSASLLPMNTAHAVDCDLIDGFSNLSGALTFSGYFTDGGDTGTQRLIAPVGPRKKCEANIEIYSTGPGITSDIHDGITIQKISQGQDFKQTLVLEAPYLRDASQARSIVLHQLLLKTSFSGTGAARMVFSLNTSKGSGHWFLDSRLHHESDPQGNQEIPFVQTWPSLPVAGSADKFWIEIDYRSVPGTMSVTQVWFRDGYVGQGQNHTQSLPAGMEFIRRVQGLVSQDEVPPGLTFNIKNGSGRP